MPQGGHQSEVAAGAVAVDVRRPAEAQVGSSVVEPGERGVDVVGRGREPVLGRQPVVDAQDRHAEPVREPPARPVVHLHVVEDEAAAVHVHQQARVGSGRPEQPDPDAVRVEIDDLLDVLGVLLERERAVGVPAAATSKPSLETGSLAQGGLDRRGFWNRASERLMRASMATATAAATRKSTRGSGTRTV